MFKQVYNSKSVKTYLIESPLNFKFSTLVHFLIVNNRIGKSENLEISFRIFRSLPILSRLSMISSLRSQLTGRYTSRSSDTQTIFGRNWANERKTVIVRKRNESSFLSPFFLISANHCCHWRLPTDHRSGYEGLAIDILKKNE